MKTISQFLKQASLVVSAVLFSVIAFAQDKSADVKVDINTDKGGNWYTQPWVWVVGGAVFVLLLVALLRGGGRERSEA